MNSTSDSWSSWHNQAFNQAKYKIGHASESSVPNMKDGVFKATITCLHVTVDFCVNWTITSKNNLIIFRFNLI